MLPIKPSRNIIDAMDRPLTTTGEKGSTAFTALGVGDPRVPLSQKLARGLHVNDLESMIDEIIVRLDECTEEQKITMINDLFVMCFQARDIEDGKGERLVSYQMFISLFEKYPDVMLALLPTYPLIYGSFKDFNLMLEMNIPKKLQNAIIDLYRRFLIYDAKIALPNYLSESIYQKVPFVQNGVEEVSKPIQQRKINLTAKWAPREGRKYGKWANRIAQKVFPNSIETTNIEHFNFWLNNVVSTNPVSNKKTLQPTKNKFKLTAEHLNDEMYYKQHAQKAYRHLVAFLNNHLDTTETHMCSQDYSGINFSKVPAKAMKLYRHAFANTWQRGSKKGQQKFDTHDRIVCAKNLENHIQIAKSNPSKAKVHGKNLQGGELVKEYVKILLEANITQTYSTSPLLSQKEIAKYEDPVLEIQFQDIINNLRKTGELDGYIPIIDTSGSMTTSHDRFGNKILEPIYTAIFLGAVISKINIPAFRGRYLTFSTNPQWIAVPEDCSLCYAVYSMYNNPNWGGSTNFDASMKMILHSLEIHNIPKDTEIKLLVASDMQFDSATGVNPNGTGSSSFHYKEVQDMYSNVNRKMPVSIYWDLAASVMNFIAPADAKNVQVVSGYSHQLLKIFMQNKLSNENIEQSTLTPYDTMRMQLDLQRYDIVRSIVSAVYFKYPPNKILNEFSEKFPRFSKDNWDKMFHFNYTNLEKRKKDSSIDVSSLERSIEEEEKRIHQLEAEKNKKTSQLLDRLKQLQEHRKKLESNINNYSPTGDRKFY